MSLEKKNGQASGLILSHLDKIFWPNEKYTKCDVIEYYREIAPVILPYLIDRPESLNRHPDGIAGPNFYQKNVGRVSLPSFIETCTLEAKTTGKSVQYLVCNSKETLLWLANFGCIEMNPWASRIGSLDRPDFLTIDLDPHGRSFDDVVTVALTLHRVLDSLTVKNFVKTSGKTGMHVMVALAAKYDYEEVRKFARLLLSNVERAIPNLATTQQRLAKRHGKIYLDMARNSEGQTVAAPYSLRPYPGATISTPLEWKEVRKGLHPSQFTLKSIFPRLKKKGDLMKGLLSRGIDLKKSAALLSRAESAE
jgi:bifunctional non-homologous end joining protein LigD